MLTKLSSYLLKFLPVLILSTKQDLQEYAELLENLTVDEIYMELALHNNLLSQENRNKNLF